jgi:hypothetical protein
MIEITGHTMIDEMEAVGFLSAADAAELLEVAGRGADRARSGLVLVDRSECRSRH